MPLQKKNKMETRKKDGYWLIWSILVLLVVAACQGSDVPPSQSTESVVPDLTRTITSPHQVPTAPTKASATPESPETPIPDLQPGTVRTRTIDSAEMVFAPAGTFSMGSSENDPDALPIELPAHSVTLDAFWIDQTEVTNETYTRCVEEGVCKESRYADSPAYNGIYWPAAGVSWQDAVDYCTWVGGRLPTEAEWEYAARGESGVRFPWGDQWDGRRANTCDANCSESWADQSVDDSYGESAPVGSFPDGASWVGALDMAGNVWEWVWDWTGGYSDDDQINPIGPESGITKVIRGGCWASPPDGVRTSFRLEDNGEILPSIRHPNIGFRCVVPATHGLPVDMQSEKTG